jgi:hypothetical protein
MLKERTILVAMATAEKIAQHILPLGAARMRADTGSWYPIRRVVKVNRSGTISFDVHYMTPDDVIHTVNVNPSNAEHYTFVADFTKANPQSTRNPDRFSVHPWIA